MQVDSVQTVAGLFAEIRDRLDPEGICRWSDSADLNLDGRTDLAFVLRREVERMAEDSKPCYRSDLVIALRKEDGAFDSKEAILGEGLVGSIRCEDSTSVPEPRVELRKGSFAIQWTAPGRDSVVQNLSFDWSMDDQTWSLAKAEERWWISPDHGTKPLRLRHEVDLPSKIALEEFDPDSFARGNFVVYRGWRLMARKIADLDKDKRQEVVYVTEAIDPAGSESGRFADGSRVLGIVRIAPGGTFERIGENARAVGCAQSGGWIGDPFTALEAGPGWFSIQDMSGAGTKVSRRQDFHWSKPDRDWLLERASTQTHLSGKDGMEERPSVLTPKEFGKIPWMDYDADEFAKRFEN